MKNRIVLFTHSFPYGTGESFLEQELPFLSENFSQITIIPCFTEGQARQCPKNVFVDQTLALYFQRSIGLRKVVKYAKSLWNLHLYAELLKKASLLRSLKSVKGVLTFFANVDVCYEWLSQNPQFFQDQSILYTYWFGVQSTAIARMKSEYQLSNKVITRAHGSDLYEDQLEQIHCPMRDVTLRHIDRVFTVSEHGRQHLINRYPEAYPKFVVSRLGVDPVECKSYPYRSGRFSFVTCSSMIPLKRIELWISALSIFAKSKPMIEYSWTHIGDGPLKDQLIALSDQLLPENVTVHFMYQISNAEVYQFYRNNRVDLFVSMSQREGIPVSMMEAMAHEIPVLTTSVGGVPELVDASTGYLIPKDPEIEHILDALENIHRDQSGLRHKGRMARRKIERDYNMQSNYSEFCETALQTEPFQQGIHRTSF